MLIPKGTFVRIRDYILLPEQRADSLPESTSKVPLKCWVKGRLQEEAELYEEATIETATNRLIKGVVKEVHPKYKHTYGDYVEEIQQMRETILAEMWGDKDE